MKKNKLIILFASILLIIIADCNAQSLELLVKKGTVLHNNKIISANQKITVLKGAIVKVETGSIALARYNNKVIELKANKVYSYPTLIGLFHEEKSFTSSFFDLLFNSDIHANALTGITTRGGIEDFNVNALQISPPDSCIILSDSISFVTGVGSKIDGKIYLYNKDNVLIDSLLDNSSYFKMISGSYTWKYKFNYKNNSFEAAWFFYVPQKEKLEELKREIKSFKESIEVYSKDLQTILWNDFVSIRKIYIY